MTNLHGPLLIVASCISSAVVTAQDLPDEDSPDEAVIQQTRRELLRRRARKHQSQTEQRQLQEGYNEGDDDDNFLISFKEEPELEGQGACRSIIAVEGWKWRNLADVNGTDSATFGDFHYNPWNVDIPYDVDEPESEEEFVCELQDGTTLPIQGTQEQFTELRAMLNNGTVVSGESNVETQFYVVNDSFISNLKTSKSVSLPVGPIRIIDTDDGSGVQRMRKNKNPYEGVKKVLLVRVTDKSNKSPRDDAAYISNKFFGTYGDRVTAASGFKGCSYGNLIMSSDYQGKVNSRLLSAPGVVDVKINIKLKYSEQTEIVTAAAKAVEKKLGLKLPGPFDHVMFVTEDCYNSCGWAAYAYVNHWISMFVEENYRYPAVVMHEFGHNMNMAHSGGMDGRGYSDHTCLMGDPLWKDDVGRMCFNPVKNFQIVMNGIKKGGKGWYDRKTIQIFETGTKGGTYWKGTLIGIAEQSNNPHEHPVVLKIESGSGADYFVGFNRAVGPNADNVDADNMVTVYKVKGSNGWGYSTSILLAKLRAGRTGTVSNWRKSGLDLKIKVNRINTNARPGYADVEVTFGPPTPRPTRRPTKKPTRTPTRRPSRPPTKRPSKRPTPRPTSLPTKQPTKAPTPKPTSPPSEQPTRPTSEPTPFPSKQPTKYPTGSPTPNPTEAPTSKSSSSPTTASPTKPPSMRLSDFPTTPLSSKQPTENPTGLPTPSLTKAPAESRSRRSGNSPSLSPSTSPRKVPMSIPTSSPSQLPTDLPTEIDLPTKSPPTQLPTHLSTSSATAVFDSGIDGGTSWSGTLIGISDYDYSNSSHHAAVVLDSGNASQWFVGFNGRHVVITEVREGRFSNKGILDEGQSETVNNWRNSGLDLVVKVHDINTNAYPGYASVGIAFGEQLTPADPTLVPTYLPSMEPTDEPTLHPTSSPTNMPTNGPTSLPTSLPTVKPTNEPTLHPASSPTTEPTNEPTPQLTRSPTTGPTNKPTSPPTSSPTTKPSNSPTRSPTLEPTTKPTLLPTSSPTTKPSNSPTRSPTSEPTTKPTLLPTSSPTTKPSNSPTRPPTLEPTTKPTLLPTSSPTTKPSNSPTRSPTSEPTTEPTSLPTSLPTTKPTASPTRSPTPEPTLKPTALPTVRPTIRPTRLPTRRPTKAPTSCGNSVCDLNETPITCPSDCVVKSFKTKTENDASERGHMFTIKARRTGLTVFSLDIFSRKSGISECMVFTRVGGYQGHEEDHRSWDMVLNENVVFEKGRRSNMGSFVPEVSIPAGSTQAFYVYCNLGVMYTRSKRQGKVFRRDDSLAIHQGVCTRNLFEDVQGVGKFSGWIRYYSTA